MFKHMSRIGGDPRQWLREWLREKSISPTDRVAHELKTLTEAMFFAGCYDQLSLGAVAALEVLARRVAGGVAAHRNPSRPQWGQARYFTGTPSIDDVTGPALRSFVVHRVKEDSDAAAAGSRVR